MDKKIPLGIDNFKELIEGDFYFIDKSLLIKQILDLNYKVFLFLRPRRFGKTLNLSMLNYYFDIISNNKKLFDKLAIDKENNTYHNHQNAYPTIFLSLKGIRATGWAEAFEKLTELVVSLYAQHAYLLDSKYLPEDKKKDFSAVLLKKINNTKLELSLKKLSEYLFIHYQKQVIILIDEYDTPFYEAYHHHYLNDMLKFMRNFFSEALKGNDALKFSVITGILRIAKESLFSGINHLKVYSVFDEKFSEHFGLTQEEVTEALHRYGFADKAAQVKIWYDGYHVGNHNHLYNPWSILNFIADSTGRVKPYWVNTGNPELLNKVLAKSNHAIKTELEQLLSFNSITCLIEENMDIAELETNDSSIWSLLVFSGYLTAYTNNKNKFGEVQLRIPNKEVKFAFEKIIKNWFNQSVGQHYLPSLTQALIRGNIESFKTQLTRYLAQTLSYFDLTGTEPERFYHALVLGMLIELTDTHQIKSNCESGYGRYDVLLIPHNKSQLGIILEFKVALDNTSSALTTAATQALTQITEKHYQQELLQSGIKNIVAIGIAFKGKNVEIKTSH